jgi:hypothetical protein
MNVAVPLPENAKGRSAASSPSSSRLTRFQVFLRGYCCEVVSIQSRQSKKSM